jgi:2-keto-4-pentenoate hydratase/2-oxohepta-3-ene-1,7-dioic acid hydratase in catechol pathway
MSDGGTLLQQPELAVGMFVAADEPFPGLVLGERVFDLSERLGRPCADLQALLVEWDWAQGRVAELARDLAGVPGDHELSALGTLPPVGSGAQIFQAAANYRQHVLDLMAGAERRQDGSDGLTSSEREAAAAELDERARAGKPFVFLGSRHAVVGAFDDVVLPSDSQQSDWEVELAVVIGRAGRRLTREQAPGVIAGYTICNDLTSRDALMRPDARALGIDWLAGKNSPTFLPIGPFLVPASQVADPMDLRLRLTVNERVMQDASTDDMLFDVASLIAHISNVTDLRPGDLVLTGSPAGNGASHGIFLAPGDVIEATITGLGQQRNVCVAETQPVAAG